MAIKIAIRARLLMSSLFMFSASHLISNLKWDTVNITLPKEQTVLQEEHLSLDVFSTFA
jgi:hypothetical protein